MKNIFYFFILLSFKIHAQYTIISPGNSSANIVTSTTNNGGLELPKLTYSQIQSILTPKIGTIVYDTDANAIRLYNGNRWALTNESNFYQQIGSSGLDLGNSIEFDKFGNLYIVGAFSNTINIGDITLSSSGFTDIFIAKYNNTGALLWAIKGGGNNEDYAVDLSVDNSGTLTITGYYYNNTTFASNSLYSNGSFDVFVVQVLGNGNYNWSKSIGGSMDDRSSCITKDVNGNTYISGFFYGTINFPSTPSITSLGNSDGFYIKLDGSGNVIWANRFGGALSDYCPSIIVDAIGYSYITGTFKGNATQGVVTLSNSNNYDYFFIAKADLNGNLIWAKKGGANNAFASGQAIILDNNNNLVIAGDFTGQVAFDGNIINAPGNSNVFIVKYDTNGIIQSIASFGNSTGANPRRISKDNYGNIFITGTYQGTLQLGNKVFTSNGSADIFVLKLNSNNIPTHLQCGGGIGTEIAYDIATKNDGTTYIIGEFPNEMTFLGTNFISSGSTDCFVIKVF